MKAVTPDVALQALRTNFAASRPTPTAAARLEKAEAQAALSPTQLLAAQIDGLKQGAIRRESRLIETLLVVIDELRERVASLEEEATRP